MSAARGARSGPVTREDGVRNQRTENEARGTAAGREGSGTPKACVPPTPSSLAAPDCPHGLLPSHVFRTGRKLSLFSLISQKFGKNDKSVKLEDPDFSNENLVSGPAGDRARCRLGPGGHSAGRRLWLWSLTTEELRCPGRQVSCGPRDDGGTVRTGGKRQGHQRGAPHGKRAV